MNVRVRIGHKHWRRNEFENWRGGTCSASGKIFLVVSLHIFGSTFTISRFGKRFRDGQYMQIG